MTPVSPVLAEDLVSKEVVYAKDQPEYIPLPTLRNDDGVLICRWKLSEEEREAIAQGADIHLSVWTFNQPLQPLLMEVLSCDADIQAVTTRMGLGSDEKREAGVFERLWSYL